MSQYPISVTVNMGIYAKPTPTQACYRLFRQELHPAIIQSHLHPLPRHEPHDLAYVFGYDDLEFWRNLDDKRGHVECDVETARMFGQGLNSLNSGGVLLKAKFDAKSIISGPNKQRQYLGEEQFTVDPFALPIFSIIESFPSIG